MPIKSLGLGVEILINRGGGFLEDVHKLLQPPFIFIQSCGKSKFIVEPFADLGGWHKPLTQRFMGKC
jgi:hypothetical protein